MEYDGSLTVLQGTICSLGSRGLLNKKDALQDVVEALRNVIENQPNDAKSKLVFFMVLNTHLSVSEKLKDDEFVGLFTNITPPIDKAYLITYIYYLNLQSELFRVIENCPGILSSELTGAIIEKLENPNFHRDEFGSEHFYKLCESVFVKVCKISIGLHANDHPGKFMDYFDSIYTLIQQILVTLMLSKNLECIVGLHLYYFFKTFCFCIKLYKNPELCDDPLYKISTETREGESGTIGSFSKACIDLILRKVVNIFENLTLDLWMTFSELYFDFDSENSMQLLIGGVVHNILQEITGYNVPSDILNCLSSLAINRLDTAGLDEIISNVRNGKKEWFEVLIKHPDVIEKKSIECLIENINLAGSDDLNKILNMSFEYISSEEQSETLDLMKELFFTAIKKTPHYSEWLEKLFENYKPNLFITAHTQDDLIETFNKMSKDKNIIKSELISLCIQSPLETIKKICHLALFGSLQTEDVIQVLKLLEHPCRTFQWEGSACIDYVLLESLLLEKLSDKEKHSFINLIVHLGEENLLGPYFAKNLLKSLKTHLETVSLEKSVLCLEITKIMLNLKLIVADEAVLLVFMSQVLGHLTWNLKNYSSVKANGRDLVVCIVAAIINGLEVKANDSKYQWARKEIMKSCEVNRACFCDLWLRFGCSWPSSGKLHSRILTLAHSRHKVHDLGRFLIKVDQSFEVRASIVLSLTMVLPVLTIGEWNSIFDGLVIVLESVDVSVHHKVLDMFGSSVYLLTLNLNGEATRLCYEYCLRNFGQLVRRVCPKMSGGHIVQTVEKIFFVLTAIADEKERKSCWMTFSPLLLELVDWVKKKNAMDAHKNRIVKLLSLLELKDIAEAIFRRMA